MRTSWTTVQSEYGSIFGSSERAIVELKAQDLDIPIGWFHYHLTPSPRWEVSPFLPYGLFSSDARIADSPWKKTCPRFLIQVLGEMENMTSAKATSSKMKASKAQETEVDMEWGLRVPMRDGVRLNATLFKPKGLRRKIPAIFTTTPYVADTWHQHAVYFARHGYVFLVFDVRGRGNSEGSFSPWENDAQDGHDIVEWLSNQPWCNGKNRHVGRIVYW